MPRINLLPWREAERKQRRQEFGVGAVGALVFAGAIAFAVNLQMSSAISSQNERNQYLKDETAKLDKQIAEILALDQEKQRLVARMQVIEQLESSRAEVVHLFDQIAKTLPDGVYLTSITQNNRKIQLKGVAQSSSRVSNYMRNLDGSDWLADPALDILETKGSGDSGSDFTLNASQESPNLKASADAAEPAPRAGARGGR
ncbi:type IV pilus assembly protein PilN [Povalibacter uvarum]|uniref:Type IV pilus assembly protein PilN n=1 Tax=Povalibacter uvarum TaxID=732238 RepID=A0A841HLY4_9GAMM|nr:PilN domain-containing protein [Povalibacter uvarum]MBB6092985.1 type IV pilus assembly protein PilN [Povalibacter uvarum]